MAVVFKYKHPCSHEYAPGYVNIGINGEQGKRGSYGSAVYFTDFELDNSYNIELALQRIENNYVLSSSRVVQLKHRRYMVNDIILSNTGNCYRLTESSSKSLFKNYKFDIKFLGKLHKSSFNNAVTVAAYDFTGSEIIDADTGDLLKCFPIQTISAVPTTRCEENFTRNFYSESFSNDPDGEITKKYFSLYGVWLKFVVFGSKSDNVYYDASAEALSGVKYTLTINLKNDKTLQGECGPDGYNKYNDPVGVMDGETPAVLHSYVPMEFMNLCICDSDITTNTYIQSSDESEVDDNTSQIFSEIIWHDDNSPRKIPSYISDYSMDMMHPSGNNIKCTLDETKSMWCNSGKDHWGYNHEAGEYYKEHLGYRSYVKAGDTVKELKYPENTDPEHDYSGEIPSTVYNDTIDILKNSAADPDKINGDISVSGFSEYSAGLGISAMNTESMQQGLDWGEYFEEASHFIEASKNSMGVKNMHPGESMYFSGLDCSNPGNITAAILKYMFSEDNTFILTSKNNKTKECISNEMTLSVNNDFKNKRIYVRCDEDNKKITTIRIENKED